MLKKREVSFLVFLLVLAGCLYFYGIDWGVPDGQRDSFVFSASGEKSLFLSPMEKARDDIYKDFTSYGEFLARGYKSRDINYGQEIIRLKSGKSREVPRYVIHCLRTYLLRSYGADEQAPLVALTRFNLKNRDFNPHFFEYGGAYVYPLALIVKAADSFRYLRLNPSVGFYLNKPEEMGRIFIVGRCLGALAAVFAVIFFYLFVRVLSGGKTAAVTSILYVFCPTVIFWAHYLKPYAYALLWFNASLFFTASFLVKNERRRLNAILASVFAGLAAGSLITYGYVFFALLLAFIFKLRRPQEKPLSKAFPLFCLVVFFGVFLVVNPYVIFSFREFMLELATVGAGWNLRVNFANLSYFFGSTLRYGLGTALWVIAGLGLFLAILRHRTEDVFLLFFLLPFFFYAAVTTTKYVHYALPLFPGLVLLSGRFLVSFASVRNKTVKTSGYFLLVFVIFFTALCGTAGVLSFRGENTRETAGKWIKKNLPYGSTVAMHDLPSPYLMPAFPFAEYRLAITGSEERVLRKSGARFFILSEYNWLRNLPKNEIIDILGNCGYTELKRIEKPTKFGPFIFRRGDNAPSDWCHPNPTFVIFEKKEFDLLHPAL